jgi:hypothetical protein
MSKAVIQEISELLLQGINGETILEHMKTHKESGSFDWGNAFKTSCSIQTYVSKIKRNIMEKDDDRKYHELYTKTIQNFRQVLLATTSADCLKKSMIFLSSPFHVKYKLLKKHNRKKFCFGDKSVDDAFKEIKILKQNIVDFRPSVEDWEICKERSVERTKERNKKTIFVKDASSYLENAIYILETVTKKTSISELGFALMITSGRRMAEIFNGKSSFKNGSTKYSAIFEGQLKADRPQIYEIPLLCKLEIFQRGLDHLRLKQGNWNVQLQKFENDKPNVLDLSNDDVNSKYASNINKQLKRVLFLPKSSNHDCRRYYIQAIWKGFDYENQTPYTFNTVAMQFLGHASLAESLNYNYMKLGTFDRSKFLDTFDDSNRLLVDE